ncbi:MAG: fibronectin type III domain-containing protein, partial [Coprococcus sp.]
KMRGALSDCVPIVVNNQVTWYVYTDNKVDFYQINAKALSNTKKITKTSKVNEVKNLKIKKAAKSSITLSWSKTSRAKGYIIYRYDNSTHKWVNIGKTTKLTYTDKKLASKTSYKYKVKAYRIISGKTYTGKSSGINARTK